MQTGEFHSDRGPLPAVKIGDPEGAEADGDTVAILSDGEHGSGLSVGWEVKFGVQRGTAVGQWSPDEA